MIRNSENRHVIQATSIERDAIEGETCSDTSQEWTWVRMAQRGDRKSLDRLVYRHDRHVLRLGLCVFGNRERARAVYLQTFRRVWRSIHRFRFDLSVRSWISQIALEVCMAELRKEKTPGLRTTSETGTGPGLTWLDKHPE